MKSQALSRPPDISCLEDIGTSGRLSSVKFWPVSLNQLHCAGFVLNYFYFFNSASQSTTDVSTSDLQEAERTFNVADFELARARGGDADLNDQRRELLMMILSEDMERRAPEMRQARMLDRLDIAEREQVRHGTNSVKSKIVVFYQNGCTASDWHPRTKILTK